MRRSPSQKTSSEGASSAATGVAVSSKRGPDALGPESRLKRKSDIDRCQKGGTKLHTKHFLILVAPSSTEHSRLAIAVTTKLEKRAVVRNLIKRRIREVFRRARKDFARPIDIVVVARREIQTCEYGDYQREILGALRSKGFLAKVA